MVEKGIVEIGHVKHFFAKINVAIVDLTALLSAGDHVLIKGPATEFEQIVTSIQVEHRIIQHAEGGQSVGLKLDQSAKENDIVYKKL